LDSTLATDSLWDAHAVGPGVDQPCPSGELTLNCSTMCASPTVCQANCGRGASLQVARLPAVVRLPSHPKGNQAGCMDSCAGGADDATWGLVLILPSDVPVAKFVVAARERSCRPTASGSLRQKRHADQKVHRWASRYRDDLRRRRLAKSRHRTPSGRGQLSLTACSRAFG